MKAEQAAQALAEKLAHIKAAAAGIDANTFTRVATDAAAMVRRNATASGDSIGIKIMGTGAGARVTITGRHASKYRELLYQGISSRMRETNASIRDQIIRGVK